MNRHGRFASAEAFEAEVRLVVLHAGTGGIRTADIGLALGPITHHFPPICGHEDCVVRHHSGGARTDPAHPSDIVRPVLIRLAKRGLLERVSEPQGRRSAKGQLWRRSVSGSLPRPLTLVERVALLEGGARSRMAEQQADLEALLGT